MDTSIRFYTTNNNLCSPIEDEQRGRSTKPLSVSEDGYAVTEQEKEKEASALTTSTEAVQQPEQVNIADFEAIFQRYQVPITNFIYHLIGNREQAYDLAQDVFVKAYKALLGGTVVHEGRTSSVSSMYERGGYDGGRFEGRVADREIVELVFRQLPAKYATCLWLYENDGFSCAEIAEVLNISSSAVKMRLMRARERFIGLYRKEVGED